MRLLATLFSLALLTVSAFGQAVDYRALNKPDFTTNIPSAGRVGVSTNAFVPFKSINTNFFSTNGFLVSLNTNSGSGFSNAIVNIINSNTIVTGYQTNFATTNTSTGLTNAITNIIALSITSSIPNFIRGTTNQIAKFTPNTNTVGDSMYQEVATNMWEARSRSFGTAFTNSAGTTNRMTAEWTSANNWSAFEWVSSSAEGTGINEIHPVHGSGFTQGDGYLKLMDTWLVEPLTPLSGHTAGNFYPDVDSTASTIGYTIGTSSKRVKQFVAGAGGFRASQNDAAPNYASDTYGILAGSASLQFWKNSDGGYAAIQRDGNSVTGLTVGPRVVGFGATLLGWDTFLQRGNEAFTFSFGTNNSGTAPTMPTLTGAEGSGVDKAGSDFRIAGGRGTGNGVPGWLYFATPRTNGASGSSIQTLVNRMSIDTNGAVTVYSNLTVNGTGGANFMDSLNISSNTVVTNGYLFLGTTAEFRMTNNAGTTGQVLTSAGTGKSPYWATAAASGSPTTVTQTNIPLNTVWTNGSQAGLFTIKTWLHVAAVASGVAEVDLMVDQAGGTTFTKLDACAIDTAALSIVMDYTNCTLVGQLKAGATLYTTNVSSGTGNVGGLLTGTGHFTTIASGTNGATGPAGGGITFNNQFGVDATGTNFIGPTTNLSNYGSLLDTNATTKSFSMITNSSLISSNGTIANAATFWRSNSPNYSLFYSGTNPPSAGGANAIINGAIGGTNKTVFDTPTVPLALAIHTNGTVNLGSHLNVGGTITGNGAGLTNVYRQYFSGCSPNSAIATTSRYSPMSGCAVLSSGLNANALLCPAGGYFTNLVVFSSVQWPVTTNVTFTIFTNNVATSLTCTLIGGVVPTTNDVTHSFSLPATSTSTNWWTMVTTASTALAAQTISWSVEFVKQGP